MSKILPDSPAEKARFKQGDVILKFNDNEIKKSTDLPLIVGQSEVGKSFRVQIIRNKLITNLSVTLEELPTEEKIASIGTRKITSNSFSGISVRNLSPQDIKSLEIKSGVIVTNVDDNINNNFDVKSNDVITKINNTIISNVDDFSKIMAKSKNNTYVNLLVYRQSTPLYIALKISK